MTEKAWNGLFTVVTASVVFKEMQGIIQKPYTDKAAMHTSLYLLYVLLFLLIFFSFRKAFDNNPMT